MLKTTEYYDEFLRYFEMAKWQHENCNLGSIPYSDTPWDDDLIKNVPMYDVVERKYAGFSQLLLDMWYNNDTHPYKDKMDENRKELVEKYSDCEWDIDEWLFVFFVHRLTGSGINYSLNNSGYHNSVLLEFHTCETIEHMVKVIQNFKGPKFTSSGYQIAPFPKPERGYSLGGDYFMCEILPGICKQFAIYISGGKKKEFSTLMSWLERVNKGMGIRVFWFQYAAVLADIADFFPEYVKADSHFFYGKNAEECLSYLAVRERGQDKKKFLDSVTDKICEDTGMLPYNAEDVACDFIRWVENYINPKVDYSHLDLDKIWSSHRIYDHPFGRQKPMLELGLTGSFNGKGHPSDDKILKGNNMTVEEYKALTEL